MASSLPAEICRVGASSALAAWAGAEASASTLHAAFLLIFPFISVLPLPLCIFLSTDQLGFALGKVCSHPTLSFCLSAQTPCLLF